MVKRGGKGTKNECGRGSNGDDTQEQAYLYSLTNITEIIESKKKKTFAKTHSGKRNTTAQKEGRKNASKSDVAQLSRLAVYSHVVYTQTHRGKNGASSKKRKKGRAAEIDQS